MEQAAISVRTEQELHAYTVELLNSRTMLTKILEMEIPAETCEGGLGPLDQLPTSLVSTQPLINRK